MALKFDCRSPLVGSPEYLRNVMLLRVPLLLRPLVEKAAELGVVAEACETPLKLK
jgi:hypothetical protein